LSQRILRKKEEGISLREGESKTNKIEKGIETYSLIFTGRWKVGESSQTTGGRQKTRQRGKNGHQGWVVKEKRIISFTGKNEVIRERLG